MNHGVSENSNYSMNSKKNVLNYILNVVSKEPNTKFAEIHHLLPMYNNLLTFLGKNHLS